MERKNRAAANVEGALCASALPTRAGCLQRAVVPGGQKLRGAATTRAADEVAAER